MSTPNIETGRVILGLTDETAQQAGWSQYRQRSFYYIYDCYTLDMPVRYYRAMW